MPDAEGNIRGISVPALPWVRPEARELREAVAEEYGPPLRADSSFPPMVETTKVSCGCDECKCREAGARAVEKYPDDLRRLREAESPAKDNDRASR